MEGMPPVKRGEGGAEGEGAKAIPGNNLTGEKLGQGKSLAEEKEELRKRLEELDRLEKKCAEEELTALVKELEEVKLRFKKQKEELAAEEEKQVNALTKKIDDFSLKLKEIKKSSKTEMTSILESSLECPVCIELCLASRGIYQCPEGHIVCGICAANPELESCPQCRIRLRGKLSRCRVLEELAKKVLPQAETLSAARKEEDSARNSSILSRTAASVDWNVGEGVVHTPSVSSSIWLPFTTHDIFDDGYEIYETGYNPFHE